MELNPELSVIVLAWNQLAYTQRCVASIRDHTDVPYELVIVDNGSQSDAADFAQETADVAVLNESNRGFSVGMNQGLQAASGRFVAFVNNDTELPARWSSRLLESFGYTPNVGIVLPAVTAAGNPFSVRSEPGLERIVVPPFRYLPSGVVYVMERARTIELGGWDERYLIASREDLDLLFSVWTSGLDVILDERVLVEHASNVTAAEQLPQRQAIWRANGQRFVDKWSNPAPRSDAAADEEESIQPHELLDQATTAAVWLDRVFVTEDRIEGWKTQVRALRTENRELQRELDICRKPPLTVMQRLRRKTRSLFTGP